jgi:hypothetical protein
VAGVCFSPEADLVGGVVLTAIGIDALRHVHQRRDHLPLAALPLLLAVHQVVEAFAWWGLQGVVPEGLGRFAVWVYLLIAFVVLPVYVPLAIAVLEPPGRRRRLLGGFVALGVVVAILLLVGILRGPVTAELAEYHLAYGTGVTAGAPIVVAYIIATCGAVLFSGRPYLAAFGAVNLVAVAVLARFELDGFASLWCAWAAVTAGGIAVYLRLGAAPAPVGGQPVAHGPAGA